MSIRVKVYLVLDIDEEDYPVPSDGMVEEEIEQGIEEYIYCLLYTSPSPRD